MRGPGLFDSSPSSSPQRWHPKLTPYRFLALGTTIGVGTAKAMATEEGASGASTTLEWVSGVAIFLILYTMSTYDESPKDPPPLLGWLFHIDCMDYLWRVLSFLRIPCPSYSSEPEASPRLNVRSHAPVLVTWYRLFVCATTACFGLIKATMTYTGYSYGANWVDWTVGVVITSVLFIIGLYENNTVGMWHIFFALDHGTETQYALIMLGLAIIYIPWIGTCFWMIQLMVSNPYSAFLSKDDKRVLLTDLPSISALRESIFTTCMVLFMVLVIVISIFAGLASVSVILSSSGLPRWKEIADAMLGQSPAWKDRYMRLESPGHRLRKKFAYHTLALTTFLLGCAVFLAFWVVSIMANVEEGYVLLHSDSQSKPVWGYLVFLGATIVFQLCGAGGTAVLIWLVAVKVLLPPLWEWRRGVVDWDRALLF